MEAGKDIQDALKGINIAELYTKLELWDKIPSGDKPKVKGAILPSRDLDNLEIWAKENTDGKFNLLCALSHLPPAVVYEHFGQDVLLWAFVESTFNDEKVRFQNEYSSQMKVNPAFLEKARLFAWRRTVCELQGIQTRSNLLVINFVNSKSLKEVDMKRILRNNWLDNRGAPKYSQDKYGINALNTNDESKDQGSAIEEPSIYLDTPAGVLLSYNKKPQAVLGLATSKPDTLMIYQLQGVTKKEKTQNGKVKSSGPGALEPIDWQTAMVELAEQIGIKLGFLNLGIQSAENNRWVYEKHKDGTVHLPLERGYAAYDYIANQLNFREGDDLNWYKRIQ